MNEDQLNLIIMIQSFENNPYGKHTAAALVEIYKDIYEAGPKEKTPKT